VRGGTGCQLKRRLVVVHGTILVQEVEKIENGEQPLELLMMRRTLLALLRIRKRRKKQGHPQGLF
jgi:hypothetical protein